MEFITSLKDRNQILFWFGLINLAASLVLLVLSWLKPLEFAGVNAWYKPLKFALSTCILVWSIGWYSGYLVNGLDLSIVNWVLVITLAFEVIYIAFQAGRGLASHYNISTPSYAALYSLMAMAASVATLAVGYIGIKFFTQSFPLLPDYYVWAIRLGIVLFFVFSFEGFAMGAKLAHTVGSADGGKGLPFFNWSRIFGDLRVAHFFGMHALQVLPILAYFVFKDVKITVAAFLIYAALAAFVLVQALQAKPLFKL